MGSKPRFPSYGHHRASGQAVVYIHRREVYLGPYGSPESRQRYAEVIADLLAKQSPTSENASRPANLSIAELVEDYLSFARSYYLDRSGKPSNHYERVHRSLMLVVDVCGGTRADKFTPTLLEKCRAEMIRRDWSRKHVNACISCVRRAWKRGAFRDLVPVEVYQRLTTLEPLRAGKTPARETLPIQPATWEQVEAILPMLGPVLRDMLLVHWLTGMRSGELVQIRPAAIDQTQPDLWLYRPPTHKGQHRGKSRVIACGPQTVAILSRHLLSTCPRCGTTERRRRLAVRSNLCGPCADQTDEAGVCGPWRMLDSDAPLFSPADAREDHYATLRANRKSKVQPSQVNRRKAKPQRPAGEVYTSNSYNQAIRRACDMAGVARFHAHQIRHSAATRIRERFGLETARAALGHSSLSTTLIYAEEDARRVAEAIRLIG